MIVRESLCKEWYYLYARNAAGWVRKDCIADCGGSDCDIQQRNGRQRDFYVITASRWRTECNPKDKCVSQITLYMGTILKKCNGKEFAGFPYNGNIAALFPVKNQNGQYEERAIQLTQAAGAVCGFFTVHGRKYSETGFFNAG